MRARLLRTGLATAFVMALPSWVFAQGAIGGVVRDPSGAVLPGVTVEAASPALIEKVRTVTTDANGQYLIVDLRPGTYSVTFTLPGFTTVKREGLSLTTGVTLPVNGQMAVGSVEETVTVTGETPVVDVQNTRQQLVLDHQLLDNLPRSQMTTAIAATLPGVVTSNSDVGGDTGSSALGGTASIHGSAGTDFSYSMDGMRWQHFTIGGSISLMALSEASIDEYAFTTGAAPADNPSGGLSYNAVPRDGGNTFRGVLQGEVTTSAMASRELPDALRTRWGFTDRDTIRRIHSFSPAVGGPVVSDRVWFYTSYRNWSTKKIPLGARWTCCPDEVALSEDKTWAVTGRVTYQASPRNKIAFYIQRNIRKFVGGGSPTAGAETGTDQVHDPYLAQGRWTSPVSSRLLLEAGYLWTTITEQFGRHGGHGVGTLFPYPVSDIVTGRSYGPRATTEIRPSVLNNFMGAVSYVTGTHAFKTGFQHLSGHMWFNHQDVTPGLRLNNGVPFQVVFQPVPAFTRPNLEHDLGVYAQDQWKLGPRVTLNLGLRFDWLVEAVGEQNSPASVYNPVPARRVDAIDNVPNWTDLNPRLGLVWDVFGNGKTAIRGTANRYVDQDTQTFQGIFNPLFAGGGGGAGTATDTRTWTDANGDFIPQVSELGPSTNLLYGLPLPRARTTPDVSEGWGKRFYNWEYSASAQHEVRPGLSATVGYYRRVFGNHLWRNNAAITVADFTPFTIVSPLNAERITMYNVAPAKRGVTDIVIEPAPDDSSVYDGVDLLASGKFGWGGLINGGVTMGRTTTERCTVSDPNELRFCKVSPGFFNTNQYKFQVVHPLPFGLQISGIFKSTRALNSGFNGTVGPTPSARSGDYITANYTVTSAIAGVPLTNGSIAVNLVEPGTLYPDRLYQFDGRLTKSLRLGRMSLRGHVEAYNLFNTAAIVGVTSTYGPNWQRPSSILGGRMVRIGGQLDF